MSSYAPAPWPLTAAPRDPRIGALVDGRFRVEARIATGGFGAIYRARLRGGAAIALKVLHPWLVADPSMVTRFRREGATLLRLRHPHTVSAIAVGDTDDGVPYIAMELLTGDSLHDRLQRDGALPWRDAVAIARALCGSLAEAHALGVVHRDLKPANVHLERRGGVEVVKLIDFGIAKIARGSAVDDGRELTRVGHMIGTCEYMSPEQILGAECRDVSDVHALGVLLHEMLTGRRPFADVRGPASMLTALLTRTPVPPSQYVAIPPALDHVVMRCLERTPEDRFDGVVALAMALDGVVDVVDPRDRAASSFEGDGERTWTPRMPLRHSGWCDGCHARGLDQIAAFAPDHDAKAWTPDYDLGAAREIGAATSLIAPCPAEPRTQETPRPSERMPRRLPSGTGHPSPRGSSASLWMPSPITRPGAGYACDSSVVAVSDAARRAATSLPVPRPRK